MLGMGSDGTTWVFTVAILALGVVLTAFIFTVGDVRKTRWQARTAALAAEKARQETLSAQSRERFTPRQDG